MFINIQNIYRTSVSGKFLMKGCLIYDYFIVVSSNFYSDACLLQRKKRKKNHLDLTVGRLRRMWTRILFMSNISEPNASVQYIIAEVLNRKTVMYFNIFMCY